MQLSVNDEPVKSYKIIGFIRRHSLKDFSSPTLYKFGEILDFTPVSAVFRDSVSTDDDEVTEEEEPVDNEEDDSQLNEEEDDDLNKDDSAIKMTASLLTVGMASLYALTA